MNSNATLKIPKMQKCIKRKFRRTKVNLRIQAGVYSAGFKTIFF